MQKALKIAERRSEATRDLYGLRSIGAAAVPNDSNDDIKDFQVKFNVHSKLWGDDTPELNRLKMWFQFGFAFFSGLYFSIPESYTGAYVRH